MIFQKPNNSLFAVLLAALLVVITMFSYFYFTTKTSFLKNKGFSRKTLYPDTINLIEKINLNPDEYKILGYDEDKIILFGQTNKTLLRISSNTPIIENIKISIDSVLKNTIQINNITYDSITKLVNIYSSNERKLYQLSIKDKILITAININNTFSKGLDLDSDKYIFTQQFKKELKFSFYGYSFNPDHKIIEKNGLESKIIMNNMIDDGELLKINKESILFISYYKNPVYVLNTSLSLLFKFNLIDTITVGPLVSFSGSNGTGILKYTSPLRICNPHFNIYNNKIFVHSLVIADNDIVDDFKSNNIIDIYDLKKQGKYIGTYYLPRLENSELKDFFIFENKIIFVYIDKVLIYEKNNTF